MKICHIKIYFNENKKISLLNLEFFSTGRNKSFRRFNGNISYLSKINKNKKTPRLLRSLVSIR